MASVDVENDPHMNRARSSIRRKQMNHARSSIVHKHMSCGVAAEMKLISVHDASETFQITVLLHTHYKTSEVHADLLALDEFFREDYNGFIPKITMVDTVGQQHSSWKIVTRVNRRTGDVWTSFLNTFHINGSLEFQAFPFDRQVFCVGFKSSNAVLDIWQLDTSLLDYPEVSQKAPIEEKFSPYLVRCELNSWTMTGVTVGVYMDDPDPVSLRSVEFEIKIFAEREPVYVLKNYIVVLYVIVAANGVALGVNIAQIGERVHISMTLLFTAVANKFVLSSMLPKVEYNTFFDVYVQTSFFFLVAAIVENVLLTPRIRCMGYSLIKSSKSATQCAEDQLSDVELMDVWDRVDAWFHVLFFFFWTGIFVFVTIASYSPTLLRPSWQHVVDNQVGNTEATMKRALHVQCKDGNYKGQHWSPRVLEQFQNDL